MRICYVNGDFVPEDKASVSVFDRGFLFSDSVYEVCLVLGGRLIDNQGHLARFWQSMEKLGITPPCTPDELVALQHAVVEKNAMQNGGVYMQISRGNSGDRNFIPAAPGKSGLVIIPQPDDNVLQNPLVATGIRVMTVAEIRWAKCDIKTTALLGAVLAKQTAKANGYDDAWFVDDGYVIEGSSSNVFIVKDQQLISRVADEKILNGITRQALFSIAAQLRLTTVERDFTVAEAQAADEAFISGATMGAIPVVEVDDVSIGSGRPGKFTTALRQLYIDMAQVGERP